MDIFHEKLSLKFGCSRGIPDLYIHNNNDEFFVEIKQGRQDGLRDTQIKWIWAHPDTKVIVIYKLGKRNKIEDFQDIFPK